MSKIKTFSFSDEMPLSSPLALINYFQSLYNGQYYELPFSTEAHGRYYYRFLYIRSALQLKTNVLTRCYQPHPLLPRQEFAKLAMDYQWFGNAYLERKLSRTGKLLGLQTALAKYTRKDKDGVFKFIGHDSANSQPYDSAVNAWNLYTFPKGSIYHLLQPDVNQEIYGVPEWLPAVIAAELNDSASQFRLRYYRNGSHAGYIMYLNDANFAEEDIDALQEALAQSKGPGNFRNLMLYAPNGKADGIKLIPISEVTARDEFNNVKSLTRDDQLAAVRVPPNIMGIVPNNTGGFGSITDAAKVFSINEVEPLQEVFSAINDWLGDEIIRFNSYALAE